MDIKMNIFQLLVLVVTIVAIVLAIIRYLFRDYHSPGYCSHCEDLTKKKARPVEVVHSDDEDDEVEFADSDDDDDE